MLLISVHFPPGDAAGALRWQKLTAYAHDRGWVLDVVTLHPDDLTKPDTNRLRELPPGTRVFGVRMPKRWIGRVEHVLWRAYRWLRPRRPSAPPTVPAASSTPRSNSQVARPGRVQAAVGDVRRAYNAWTDYYLHAGWARAATRVGAEIMRSTSHEIIVTCGPPHLAHEAGRRLSRRTGRPLVIDLRDPWRLVQRLADVIASPVWHWLARFYEPRIVAQASLVVMNTEPAQRAMQATYPEKADHIIAVRNGYDDEPLPSSRHGAKFTIAYAGTVYLDRDPRVLFEVVAAVIRSLNLSPDDLGIELMGHMEGLGGGSIQMFAAQFGIESYVHALPPGPRSAAMEFLASATMLLILPQDSDMAIPSKLFEYVRFDAWLLALAHQGSAIELLLRDSGANVVAPDDRVTMQRVITERYQQYRAGQRPTRLSNNVSLSRREQARLLFDAIDRALGHG